MKLETVPYGRYNVWINYGKIGTAGTIENKQYSTFNQAEKFIQAKERQKLNKNYMQIPNK